MYTNAAEYRAHTDDVCDMEGAIAEAEVSAERERIVFIVTKSGRVMRNNQLNRNYLDSIDDETFMFVGVPN